MKYSVRFYPEKRKGQTENLPIRLRVTYSLNKMEYYTGLRCNVSQWDVEAGKLKKNQVALNGKSSMNFNADLDEIKVAVNSLFKVYDATNATPTPDQLRNDLKLKLGKEAKKEAEAEKLGFFQAFEKYMKDSTLSAGRIKHIKVTCKKVQTYRPDLTFDTLDSQFLTDFRNHLLGDCNQSNNTAICELRRLRAFIGHAIDKGWTSINAFKSFKVGAESYGDPVYISIEERDHLFNAKIDDELLAKVRDIFVFQCLIGCRVGDLLKMTKDNIISGNIEYIAAKVKDKQPRVARVPLTTKAKAILDRYNLPNNQLLPFITEQEYNLKIKEVFKLDSVKITRLVTVPDPKTRKSIQVSIADIASSHMARRVFIGGLHKKGVKNEIIASMSGHVKDSKAFARYYNIDEEDQKNAINLID